MNTRVGIKVSTLKYYTDGKHNEKLLNYTIALYCQQDCRWAIIAKVLKHSRMNLSAPISINVFLLYRLPAMGYIQ
jgi:hypothetical protein